MTDKPNRRILDRPTGTLSLLATGSRVTGHIELGFALKNTSSGSCHTYGYPGILFLGAGGQGLTTDTTRTTHDFFGSLPPRSRK